MSKEERISVLQNAEPNTWIAFSANEDRVVASGKTPAEAAHSALEAGEDDPLLTFVPSSWNPMVLSGA